MFCVGLTGGVGSGKSAAAEYFKKLGVEIIDADDLAHKITQPNTYSYESIIEHFGQEILNPDNTLNRRALRTIIFNQPEERHWIEKLLHPIIREAMKSHVAHSNTIYCILVIPLLYEKDKYPYLNRICLVTCPESLRIQRIMQRDNVSESDVEAIINSQIPNEKLSALANDIISNDSDLESLKRQVFNLHQTYLEMAKTEK